MGHTGQGWVSLNEFQGLWDTGSVRSSLASGPAVRRARGSCPALVGRISEVAGGVGSGLGHLQVHTTLSCLSKNWLALGGAPANTPAAMDDTETDSCCLFQ